MPPRPRITREMIIEAAFAIARREGIGAVNARTIAGALGCSTQPVLYHFAHVEEVRREVYRRADELHTGSLMRIGAGEAPMLANNTMALEEGEIIPTLETAFLGMVGMMREEESQ